MSMPLLDKKLFKKTLEVVGVRVEAKKIGRVVKRLHGHLLNLPRLRNVVPDPTNPDPYKNSSSKLILLNAKVKDAETLQPLNEELVSFLKDESLAFVSHAIELDYSYFAVDQVLSELLPKGMDIPSSFETVGHIAHLNLRDNQLPYKHHRTGHLDKNAQIRTVVNKTDNIETKFRTFPMEVLAGDDDMEVEVHESKATFRFNYAEVYWNSRLQQEHLRVIRSIKPHDVVCDMMCGIGPFAIPVALNGSKVYANDLNPRSYHYLKENITVNQVEKLVTPYNLDGREFLAKLLGEKKQFTQVLMNLPAIALEFLDAFPGQFDHWEGELPYIHCYCFSNADDVKKDVKERAEKIMGGELDLARTSLHLVRDVAPKKVMVCISFQLPESIAFSAERRASKQDDPKRRKVEADAAA
ncbi:tRNA (guanine(37)-N1)-methyltransferase [Phytophthora ramorum]|uniref:tRNA (guanine(37)-N1)-methyltransferase n=1 Tax=Phytophthora ramorum TaxID=164328 RepID=UPI0030AA815C|nr:tRNA (guanine(37)-N1)-methyltransferase [Phytophthora ramorum]